MQQEPSDKSQEEAKGLIIQLARIHGLNLRETQDVVGEQWEEIVDQKLCEMYGLENVKNLAKKKLRYDFIVFGKKIQCKTDSGLHNKSGVSLHPDMHTAYSKGDFDYFIVRHGNRVYVAPFSVLVKPDGTVGSWFSTTNGQRWLDRWDIIGDGVDPNAVRPGRLFPGGA